MEPLRLTVNTDNPGIHLITAKTEMAMLMAMGLIQPHEAVFLAMESFASRLGGRPFADIDKAALRLREALLKR